MALTLALAATLPVPYNCVNAEVNLPTAVSLTVSSAPFCILPNTVLSKYSCSLATLLSSTGISSSPKASFISAAKVTKP